MKTTSQSSKLIILVAVFWLPVAWGELAGEQFDLVVHVGNLIAEPGEGSASHQSLLLKNGRIAEIRDGFVDADGVDLLDLSKMHVLPGLIDCHTHLTLLVESDFLISMMTNSPAYSALKSVEHAKRTLKAGFTTVRDVGAQDGIDLALKRAIEEGHVVGPRMFVSAKDLSITGGHGDVHIGIREDYVQPSNVMLGIVDGVDDAIAATRLMIRRGADHIKVSVSGGVLSLTPDSAGPQFSSGELRSIVDTARDFGRKVAAHAHGDEGARRAIEAGVSSIEHGTFLSDETFSLMRKRSVFLVPTLSAGKTIEYIALAGDTYPEVIAVKALQVGPLMQSAFARAHKAGVPIAFGTDAGVFSHGENAKEFIYMTEAGMTPVDAIRSATVNAAELIGSDEIGVLKVGAYADFIAVDSDPRENVAELADVDVVVKSGVIYKDQRLAVAR